MCISIISTSHFLDGEVLVGRVSEGDYLPEEDAERPDVGFGGVDTVEYRLGGHPLDRQPSAGHLPVVFRRLHVPASATGTALKPQRKIS